MAGAQNASRWRARAHPTEERAAPIRAGFRRSSAGLGDGSRMHTGHDVSTPRPRSNAFHAAAGILRASVAGFARDDVLTLSASLAFYTLLSFAPLIVFGVLLASIAGPASQEAMLEQIGALVGPAGREAAAAVIASGKSHPSAGTFAGFVGLGMLVLGATTVFAQLQSSLNSIFGVVAKPTNAIWGWLRRRILSFGVIFAIAFVFITSLLASALLGLLLPRGSVVLDAANQLASAAVFSVLFGLLFRYLPDARIDWHWAWRGGLVTAILFALGKWGLAAYLARGDVGGAYGAAGSLAVLLVWVYYAGAIVFFGAELTRAWMGYHDNDVVPLAHAERA